MGLKAEICLDISQMFLVRPLRMWIRGLHGFKKMLDLIQNENMKVVSHMRKRDQKRPHVNRRDVLWITEAAVINKSRNLTITPKELNLNESLYVFKSVLK